MIKFYFVNQINFICNNLAWLLHICVLRDNNISLNNINIFRNV